MADPSGAAAALQELLERLDLEQIDSNIFRGHNQAGEKGRIFGGQVAAQALVAAGRTVPGLPAHSLHGYFLRPGDCDLPVVYTVDRIRDGRSFTTRRVVAQQRGKAIFNMSVSFHETERGYEHQVEMPDAPDPESIPTWAEYAERPRVQIPEDFRDWVLRPGPIERRHVDAPTFLGGEPHPDPCLVWLRAASEMPDDALMHQCVLTYATDMSLLDCVVQRHGRVGELGPLLAASLDHVIWLHKPVRADQWLLYLQDSPLAFGARGLARGSIFTRAGELVASVAQEVLLRPVEAAEDRSV